MEITAEARKEFARAQLRFLRQKGVTDQERLSRIFKASGPGQIREAWKLANSETSQERIDLLDVVLTGVCGSQNFGRSRMESVLKECGIYVPEAPNTNCFFRVLDGALEILVPGSYEFEEKDLEQIRSGGQSNDDIEATQAEESEEDDY